MRRKKMNISDPIADLLTRIRNSSRAQKRYVDIPLSKIKEQIVSVLKEKGFILDYKVVREDKPFLRVYLRYDQERAPVIKALKRESKPGIRKYISYKEIPYVLGGMGASVLSTSQGIMEGAEARKRKIGGELLCIAW